MVLQANKRYNAHQTLYTEMELTLMLLLIARTKFSDLSDVSHYR